MTSKHVMAVISIIMLCAVFIHASADENDSGGVIVISEITVTKDAAYERYRKAVKPVIENCGGRYIVRAGGKFVTDNPSSGFLSTSGDWNPDRMVVLHFASRAAVADCFNSDEYKAAYALREGGTSGRSIVVNAYQADD